MSHDGLHALSQFWTTDTPAIGGPERILLYGTLLLLMHFSHFARPPLGDSPLQAPELFANTDLDLFFEVRGAIEYVPLSWLRTFGYRGIDKVRRVVYVSWLFCVLGIFGHTPVVVTSLGITFLEMIKISCTGVGHRMHLVVYTLVFLSLSNGRRSYSLDEYLFRNFPDYWWPFNPHLSHRIFYSGISTKLILVASSFTLWSGAWLKIANGGWRWLDGSTLAWQTISSPFGAFPLMKTLFSIPAFAAFSSVTAVLFEGLSVVVQLPTCKSLRFIWMLMCFSFHLVIYLTMNPNYLPQSITYIPCVLSWSESSYPAKFVVADATLDPFGFASILFATMFLIVLVGVAIFRVEAWPFTCVPMYSYYRGQFLEDIKKHAKNGNVENAGISNEELHNLALEYKSINPRCIGWLDAWVDVRLMARSTPTGTRRKRSSSRGKSPSRAQDPPTQHEVSDKDSYSLREFIRKGRAQRSLYRLTLSKVICETVLWRIRSGEKSIKTNPSKIFLELLMSVLIRTTTAEDRKIMELAAAVHCPTAHCWDVALCYRGKLGGWVPVEKVEYK